MRFHPPIVCNTATRGEVQPILLTTPENLLNFSQINFANWRNSCYTFPTFDEHDAESGHSPLFLFLGSIGISPNKFCWMMLLGEIVKLKQYPAPLFVNRSLFQY
jgi:hypothetical protein